MLRCLPILAVVPASFAFGALPASAQPSTDPGSPNSPVPSEAPAASTPADSISGLPPARRSSPSGPSAPPPAPVSAQACIEAHAEGQELRQSGRLRGARQRFAQCVAPECPAPVRSDCTAFAAEVDAAQPSIVLSVRVPEGAPGPATARIDGAADTVPIPSTPIVLDPGPHRIDFVLPDGRVLTRSVLLQQGQKSVPVHAEFEPAVAATPAWQIPTITYVLGGVGLVAGASFVAFALDGSAKESDLDECAPRCDPVAHRDDIDSMRTSYLLADVSLGVALVSLGVGAYFLFQENDEPRATTGSRSQGGLGFSGSIEPGGFRVQAAGAF